MHFLNNNRSSPCSMPRFVRTSEECNNKVDREDVNHSARG